MVELQEWNRWEVGCSHLGRQLDELEASVSGGDAGDDFQPSEVQHRLQTCQVCVFGACESMHE